MSYNIYFKISSCIILLTVLPILFLEKKIYVCHDASSFKLENSPKPSKKTQRVFLPLALSTINQVPLQSSHETYIKYLATYFEKMN